MFKNFLHTLDIIIQKPVFAVGIQKADGIGGFGNDIRAAVIIGMKEQMPFGIKEKHGGRKLPKAPEIGG